MSQYHTAAVPLICMLPSVSLFPTIFRSDTFQAAEFVRTTSYASGIEGVVYGVAALMAATLAVYYHSMLIVDSVVTSDVITHAYNTYYTHLLVFHAYTMTSYVTAVSAISREGCCGRTCDIRRRLARCTVRCCCHRNRSKIRPTRVARE